MSQEIPERQSGTGPPPDAEAMADHLVALLEEFDSLVSDVLDHYPDLERVLASTFVSHEERVEILGRVFGGRASPMLLNFLKVVSRRERLDLLRPVRRRAHEQYRLLRGRLRVRLTTPVPIDDALAGTLTEQLRTLVGGEAVVERMVDPSLIGGAVVQIGDTIYDGSIAAQLEQLRRQIIDRSVHEIQSRRDRFSYPAGD